MFKNRIIKLQESLSSENIDAFLVSSSINIHYLTGYSNFSREEREAYLFITKTNALLFTDYRYIEAVERTVPKSIEVLHIDKMFNEISAKGKSTSDGKSIGIEQNYTVAELKRFKKETGLSFALTKPLVENLRRIKNAEEIKNIKLACQLTDKAYSHVLKNIRMNVTEKEIAWEIEKFIKESGGTLAFDSIVAFGPNSSIPHHATSNKKLSNKDEFVLLDFGAKVNGYCADMTRTILTKSASDRAKKIYQIVKEAQSAALEYINKSKNPNGQKAHEVANKVIASNGFSQIPHGLGHGIGLEVHEKPSLSPKSKDTLITGMIFTIEPGIYLPAGRHGIPGFGGVRIEDDFLVTEKGIEQLTKSPV